MIIDKKLVSQSGKYDAENASVEITWNVLSDNWEDGTWFVLQNGIARHPNGLPKDNLINPDGTANGWLEYGMPYKFGYEHDYRIVASEISVSDRKVIRGENEFEIKIIDNLIKLERIPYRMAIVQWTVTQTFKPPSFENDEPDDEPSEDDLFTLKCGKEWIAVPFTRDVRTGNLILNSAKDAFNPTPSKQIAIRTYNLSRKEKQNRLRLYDEYENVVNDHEWYGMPRGTVLIESIQPSWDGKIFTVEYDFKYNKNGWGEKYLDTGLKECRQEYVYEKDSDGFIDPTPKRVKKYYPILDSGSQTPVEEPAKLDGSGQVPYHRETKVCPFLDDTGQPVTDHETGEVLWYETGEIVQVTVVDDKGNETEVAKKYENFPGVDLPFDPPSRAIPETVHTDQETGLPDLENAVFEPIPESEQNYYWKYEEKNFDLLRIPNPYTVTPPKNPDTQNQKWQ
jgi:hypothetical protein